MPSAAINGLYFHFEQKGDGTPLVLLHGYPLDGRIFLSQLDDLSRDARVIVPDLRGFGKTITTDPFTIESLADDTHALLHAIGALPCVIGGLSMGGYIALAFVKKYPNDCRGLALINTRADADSSQQKIVRDRMIELVKTKGADAIANALLDKLIAPNAGLAIKQNLRDIMASQSPITIASALRAMRDRPDRTSELPDIRIPTQIVVGELDSIAPPAVARAMAQQIPHANLHEIANCGHLSSFEAPAELNSALRALLAKVEI